jgi:hypothetical protein
MIEFIKAESLGLSPALDARLPNSWDHLYSMSNFEPLNGLDLHQGCKGGASFLLPKDRPTHAQRQRVYAGPGVLPAYQVDAERLILRAGLAKDVEFGIETPRGRRGDGGNSGDGYTLNLRDLVVHLLEVGGAFGPCVVGALVNGDYHRYRVVGVITEPGVGDLEEALDSGSGPGQHDEGQRDLASNERVVNPVPAHAAHGLMRVGPMPSATETTAVKVSPGILMNCRKANRNSWRTVFIGRSFDG